MIHASPTMYMQDLDGQKVEILRQQFIGEYRGLRYLSRLLAEREADLRALIKEQEIKQ